MNVFDPNVKPHISPSSWWVVGNIREEIKPMVDIYNTWVSFFMKLHLGGQTFRYAGSAGNFILQDTVEAGKAILILNENPGSETIGMIRFMEDIIDENLWPHKFWDTGNYPNPKFIKQKDHAEIPVMPEYSFYEIVKMLKTFSMKRAAREAGIYLSIDIL